MNEVIKVSPYRRKGLLKKRPAGKAATPIKAQKEQQQGIKKTYLKTKNVCRVTFRLPESIGTDAQQVNLVGDFNNWDQHSHPMKKLKNGAHTVTLDLEPGHEYQFRYLIDGARWENDWQADKYVLSPYRDCDNSVLIV